MFINPNHPSHLTLSSLHWYPYVCSLQLCLYFCFTNKCICTIFLDFTYKWYYIFVFLFLTYFPLYGLTSLSPSTSLANGTIFSHCMAEFLIAQLIKNPPAVQDGVPSLIPGSGRSTGEGISYPLHYSWASLVAQLVKNLPAVQETWVRSLGWEDPLE